MPDDPRAGPPGPSSPEEEAPTPDPRALPNPGKARTAAHQGGVVDKPFRALQILTTDRQIPLDFETRAPFVAQRDRVGGLPVQSAEQQIAQVHADIAARVQQLEEMLDNPELGEPVRGAILLEISRLREAAP